MSTKCEICTPIPVPVPGEPEGTEAAIEYVLSYVRSRPGVGYQEIVTDRPPGISRKRVEATVKHLLYHANNLRSDHPEGTHGFGRGQAKLWIVETKDG